MQYQWILFDADETLFHFDAYQGLKLMFSWYDIDFTVEDYQQYQQLNKPLWVQYQDGQISATKLQNTRFQRWSDKTGVATQTLNSEFLRAMAQTCALLPGAQALIDSLSDKVPMGIITNGFTELQTVRLEKVGLKSAFFPLVISEQVGVAKPDPAIFEHALKFMDNTPKDKILMVGDNPHSDIKGGINAGIHTCWFNANVDPTPPGIDPHYQVKSLEQLQKLLVE
jgi:putative hydrolase of the HAD superfamily